MSMLDIIRRLKANRLTTPRTSYSPLGNPLSIAPQLDVDRVHRIFMMAESGSTEELFCLYRDMMVSDSHSQAEWLKRKLAVVGRQSTIIPADEKNENDVAAATFIERQLDGCSGWLQALGHLLDSSLYPVSVAEKVYAQDGAGFRLAELAKIEHRFEDYAKDGNLKIKLAAVDGRIGHESVPPDADRYIVHRGNLLGSPDHFGGPMRSIVFWWLLSTMDRGWWARFLDRFGSPFLVGKYESGDNPSKRVLEAAFDLATKIGGLVISRDTEVEIKQAIGADAGTGFERFLTICQREKSKAIIGQTLSAEAESTGLGSGVSKAHESVREDIRIFDSTMLASTLRSQLFEQLLRINGLRGRAPQIVFGGESKDDSTGTATLLQSLGPAGLRVSDDGIRTIAKRVGFSIERSNERASSPLPIYTHGADNPFDGIDAVALSSSADLSQAFRGDLAPVARIVSESSSADECLYRLREFTVSLSSSRAASLIEQAMTAYAANGLSRSR